MAKGQQRGNREAKKPKQVKLAAPVPAAPPASSQKTFIFAQGRRK
jgi:hypothetical protein